METPNAQFPSRGLFERPETPAGSSGPRGKPEAFQESSLEKGSCVVDAYLQVAEAMKTCIGIESELPFPKERIAREIVDKLADYPECDLRRRLEIAYVLLECFIPLEEYRMIEDFKAASFRAQRIAGTGDPLCILRSARIMKKTRGDRAVKLQERIHESMRKRQVEILRLRQKSVS